MNKFLKAAVAVAGSALVSAQAFAAGYDLSADITAAKSDISTNGTAILGVVVAIAVVAWIRRLVK